MLVLVTLLWGSTFALIKTATEHLPTAGFVALRFIIALIPMVWLLRGSKTMWRDAAILGSLSFVSYMSQAMGLQTISANRSAFITALNVIMVPLMLAAILRYKIPPLLWGASGLALLGIGLISWEGGSLAAGDAWTLLCAFAYAGYIVYLERVAAQHPSWAFSAMQIAVIAVLCSIWALPDVAHIQWQQVPWGIMIYLGLAGTIGTTVLQTFGQRWVSSTEAAIIYALEPVFAAVFAFFWLQELVGLRGFVGGALIVGATVLSQVFNPPNPATTNSSTSS